MQEENQREEEKNTFLLQTECISKVKYRDTGYAWVVLFALFFSNVLTAGYVKSFGMTYNAIISEYPTTSKTMAGVMLGLLAGCRSIFAPLSGALSNRFGVRFSMFSGAMMCFTALISSLFCTTVMQLAITLGGMMGIGLCMIESCQVITIADFFEDNLPIANGIRVAGNPLGGMLYPFLTVHLLETYGASQFRLILAGVLLNILVCMAIIRPISTHQKIQILNKLANDSTLNRANKKSIYLNIKASLRETKMKNKKPLKYNILLNPVYLIFIATVMSVSLALPTVLYYLPIYGKAIGLTPFENSILLSFTAILDLVLRLILGYLSNKKIYKKLYAFIFTLILGGVGASLIPVCSSTWSLLLVSAIFTFGSAGYYSFINVVLTDQFGKEVIATTWGFVRMVQGIFNFIFPPILGYIVDISGGYIYPFSVMGLGMISAGLILLLEPLLIKLTNSNVIIS